MLPPTINNIQEFCYYCLINKKDKSLYICLCGLTTCTECIDLHLKHMENFPQTHEDIIYFDNYFPEKELNQKELKDIWLKNHKGKFFHNTIGEIKDNEIQFFNIKEEEKFIINRKILSLWNNLSDCIHLNYKHIQLRDNEEKIKGLIKLKGRNFKDNNIKDDKLIKEIMDISKCNYACFTCISETTSELQEINISETNQPLNLYLCLSCFTVNCGKNNYIMIGKDHMKTHYEDTGHEIVVQLYNGLCFCYKCNTTITIPGIYEYLKSIGIYKYVKELNKKKEKIIPNYKEKEKENSRIIFDLTQHYEDITEINNIDFLPIPNYKNTCYVSTTFQLLNKILNKKGEYDIDTHIIKCTNDTYFDCLGCWILKIFKYFNNSKSDLIICDFLNNLYFRTPQFQINRHEDASEFLNYIFCIIESFEGKDSFPFLMNSLKIYILKISLCESNLINYISENNNDTLINTCKESISITTDYSYTHIIGFNDILSTTLNTSIEPIKYDCSCGKNKLFKEFLFPSNDLLIDLKRYNYDYINNIIEKIDNLIKPDILKFNSNFKFKGKEIINFNLLKLINDFKIKNQLEIQTIKILDFLINSNRLINSSFISKGTVLHLGTADSGHYMLMIKDNSKGDNGIILSDDKLFECKESLIENGYIFWYKKH